MTQIASKKSCLKSKTGMIKRFNLFFFFLIWGKDVTFIVKGVYSVCIYIVFDLEKYSNKTQSCETYLCSYSRTICTSNLAIMLLPSQIEVMCLHFLIHARFWARWEAQQCPIKTWICITTSDYFSCKLVFHIRYWKNIDIHEKINQTLRFSSVRNTW